MWTPAPCVLAACVLAGCASSPAPPNTPDPTTPPAQLVDLFPHVRFDKAGRAVEIDGAVPIDCHNPKTPRVYLEVTVCTRNSREHESLVVTEARPSDVHAALLLAGLLPGEPGSIRIVNRQPEIHPPTGSPVTVTFRWRDQGGAEHDASPLDWVIDTSTREHLSAGRTNSPWVFAGSRIITWNGRDSYDADNDGTLVGLTTFGNETIALTRVLSPDSAVQDPEWIADITRVPAMGTPVVVRIEAVKR